MLFYVAMRSKLPGLTHLKAYLFNREIKNTQRTRTNFNNKAADPVLFIQNTYTTPRPLLQFLLRLQNIRAKYGCLGLIYLMYPISAAKVRAHQITFIQNI